MANDPLKTDESTPLASGNPSGEIDDITEDDLASAVTLAVVSSEPIPETETTKIIICTFCTSDKIKVCFKCNRPFCFDHSSRFSPNFCKDCFTKLQLVADKFTKTVEDYNPATDTVRRRSEVCDRLAFDGIDWVFYTKWVHQLTDDELAVVYEFHYFVLKLIESANETRIIIKRDKLKQYKRKGLVGVITTEKTTETKVKKVSKSVDLGTMLRAKFPNMPQAVIDTMVKAAQNAQENGE